MIINTLKALFERDLKRLITEIEQYKSEDDIWKVKGQINNSAGNLCLHLIGNLNTYIGKELGRTDYIRNRDLEFSSKGIPRQQLIQKVENTIEMINKTFDNFDENLLQTEYPILVFDEKTSTEYLLVHLTTHLAYHLGQINYHRRLMDVEHC
ncbi:DinB family protein [Chryseobacterium sp. 2R14A]|uniref:DinB family protein n=1 Tax=Chryseobacterium sp. 2R14A TaxID=3380353 RepID=UPI003CF1ED6B